MRKDRYSDGLNMGQFNHISEISQYNSNYYIGFDNDLLYGRSDDFNTTEWYLIDGDSEPIYLGESYSNENEEILHIYPTPRT